MTDIFRKEYKKLDPRTKDDILMIKSMAEKLNDEFDLVETYENTDKRMIALAKTNLEQSVMWAIKAIT